MSVGDLINMKGFPRMVGIVIYKHPTKGAVMVHWPDDEPSWESCARLSLISSCDQKQACPLH